MKKKKKMKSGHERAVDSLVKETDAALVEAGHPVLQAIGRATITGRLIGAIEAERAMWQDRIDRLESDGKQEGA